MPRTRRLTCGLILAGLVVVAVAACGGSDGDGGEAAAGTFVGRVGDTGALVAVISSGEEVAGYACDGEGMSRWFTAEALDGDGTAALVGRDGTELGSVTVAGDGSPSGELELEGASGSFTLEEATGDAGLYRAAAREGEQLVVEAGWIVLGDGSQTGNVTSFDGDEGTVAPAPRLDPAAGRVQIRDFGSLAVDHLTTGIIDKLAF